MQAVFTKFLGPTTYRGARIRVTTGGGITKIIPCDDRKGHLENHRLAVLKVLKELDWTGKWVAGDLKTGFAYVRVPERRWRKRLFVQGM